MSYLLQTPALLEAVRAALISAWGDMPVSYGAPRVPISPAPYAVVHWDAVEMSYSGLGATLGSPSQKNLFTVIGRFPFPSDPTEIISLLKVSQANALITQLQALPEFAGVGVLPLVSRVDATEPDDPNERVFEVSISFSVVTV